MKILAVADTEEKALWDFYDKERTEGVDLIISCGDLNHNYLDFLVTMVNCPLLYVRGNHDHHYDQKPPLGCTSIDGQVYNFNGLRILGLGGCMRYKPGGDMYTEEEMKKRIRKVRRKIRRMKGIDLVVTHAPAKGYGDLDDLPHRGYACFNDMLEQYRPKIMLHGHVHTSYGRITREYMHPSGTRIINCSGSQMIELEDSFFTGENGRRRLKRFFKNRL